MKYRFLACLASVLVHSVIAPSDLSITTKEKASGLFKKKLYLNEKKIGDIVYDTHPDKKNYIILLKILKPFKKQGYGTSLLLDAMNHLISINTKPTQLLCKPELAYFYARLGFKTTEEDITAASMWYDPVENSMPQEHLNKHNSQKKIALSTQ